jgi:nickel-dependent lactate racemase
MHIYRILSLLPANFNLLDGSRKKSPGLLAAAGSETSGGGYPFNPIRPALTKSKTTAFGFRLFGQRSVMEIPLRYGRSHLRVRLPEDRVAGVLRMRPLAPLADPEGETRRALLNPIGTPPLKEIARGKKRAVIALCDVTRPVPNPLLLRPLLETLHEAGLSRDSITLLIATGLHRPNEGAELEEMIGAELVRDYRVINHDGRDDDAHADLGVTRRGTPVFIDRSYVEADLKIVTGLAEPHLMAGYSGGRKVVCPGLGSWRTVRVLHSPSFLEHPACAPGRLDDNPLHLELVEIARKAGVDFVLNVTLNEMREVTGVFGGELERAHLAAVGRADEAARIPVERPADVVLTTGAGYPLDTTFYQSVKGISGALPALKPGGTLIVAASLSEGVGGPEFQRTLFRRNRLGDLMEEMLSSEEVEIDQWQIEELGIARRRGDILFYSDGLDAETLGRCHVRPIDSVEEGVSRALAAHGPDSRLLVIPEGPYVLPYVGS